MPKVSVIVPVYGAERYIERCARSLFEQTLEDIEYIFVNDATRDKSIEILTSISHEYPSRRHQINIVNLERNQGVANARMVGMKTATGDYVIHCDPDDWVDKKLYESMYHVAVGKMADIVVCNFIHITSQGNIFKDECSQIKSSNPLDLIKTTSKPFWGSLWNKLINRSLYVDNNVFPYPGINYTEDLGVSYRLFFYAKSIASATSACYYYNGINETSACHQNNLVNWESMEKIINNLSRFLKERGQQKYELAICFLKFSQKTVLLYNDDLIDKWRRTYPESHKYIMSYSHYSLNERRLFWLVTKSKMFYYAHHYFSCIVSSLQRYQSGKKYVI